MFSRPMRRASHAAATCETAFRASRREKQHRELAFREAVSLEEPIGDQGGAEKPAADAIDAEQEGKFCDGARLP